MQIDLRIFENLPQHVYVFAVILALLTAAFLLFFLVPSFFVSWRLSAATRRVRGMDGKPPAEIGRAFGEKGVLSHLWREYSHTLHEQESTPGPDPIVRWRSTVPAEALFRPEIVVDTPLKTEFFRHLPGIFTGIGIIGTFFGLLIGLRAFQVSENPVIVRDSLNSLLHGVYEAFLVSAVAIALAMVVTLIERLVIARLYAKVEKLVQVLDALFEAGAGEEYLARLVKASETSIDRNTELSAELRTALREIGDRQIAATNAMAERLSTGIEAGLRQPLLDVAEGLRGLRTEQWGAVQGMLDQVMSGHTQKLQGLFGEQVTGIHALEAKTIDTLNTAVARLEQMAMNVESAGTRGASAMSDRLAQSFAAAEERQRTMNDTMTEFVQQIRNVVAQSQGETLARLNGTLDELSNRMREVIERLANQVQATTETSRQHHEALAGQTSRMVSEVGGQVTAIVEGVNRAVAEMKSSVEQMSSNLEAAGTRGASAMAEQLGQALTAVESRQSAMNETVSTLVQQTIETSRQQHEALAGQTSRLVGEVGGQVSSVVDGVNRAVAEMRSAVEQMSTNLEAAGTRGASAMAEQLGQALAAVESRQSAMNDTVSTLVQQTIETSRQQHEALAGQTSRMVGEVGGQVSSVIDGVNRAVAEMKTSVEQMSTNLEAAGTRGASAMAEQLGRALAGAESRQQAMNVEVSAIVDGVNRAVSEMKGAVDAMQRSTNDALVSLNMGANTVSTAVADFAKAGEAVSGAIEKSDVVAERLAQAAQSVAGVSRGLTSVVSDYEGARTAIAQLVTSLQTVVDQAKRETALTQDTVARIERAASALADAQRNAGDYLERVSDVIGEAHGTFSQGVRQTLEDVNKDFHRQLSESVKLLRFGIQELQAAVESVSR